ncbi:nucleotidyltransferase family protein [Devosia sp. Naph2]|uniref:nucleotidyltransferase family protein n=1 Tax=Devosia polycyclovorans TaxID=3345148 RepID=UPI0035CFF4B2
MNDRRLESTTAAKEEPCEFCNVNHTVGNIFSWVQMTPTQEKLISAGCSALDAEALLLVLAALRHHFNPDSPLDAEASDQVRRRALELAHQNKIMWHTGATLGTGSLANEVQRLAIATTLHNAFIVDQLVYIMDKILINNKNLIVLKGVAQQEVIYGNTSVRASNDIDILSRPSYFFKAREMVTKSGFEIVTPSPWWWAFLGEQHLVKFLPRQVSLDLHHQLHQPGVPGLNNIDGLFQRARRVDFGTASILTLDTSDIALLLVISVCKALLSREANTGFITDLFALLIADAPYSVNSFLTHAATEGLRGHALVALRILDLLFGTTYLPFEGKKPLAHVDDTTLLAMSMTPQSPLIAWPRRRTLISAFCDGNRWRAGRQLALVYSSELAMHLLERPYKPAFETK